MTARQIVRISHRGGGSLAPENSIEGIEKSIEHGVEMVEVDVRVSRDGALVLSHDPAPHGTGALVAESTLEELRARLPDIAVLDDALAAVRGRVRLNLDIKDPAALAPAIEQVRAAGVEDGCIISCLEPACLRAAVEIAPDVPRFFSYPPDYGGASSKAWMKPAVSTTVAMMRMTMHLRLVSMLRPLPGTNATIYFKLITPKLVALARRLNIDLYTWTVDDAPTMIQLAAMGVDGITSNRPDLLARLSSSVTQAHAG
jgi:glycerophosphoryl diester phosphodiesterase